MKKQVYKLGLFAFLGLSAMTFAQVQDGVVGINTESPKATLDVKTKTGVTKSLRVENTSGAETVTILENGNVGVAAQNPQMKLAVGHPNFGLNYEQDKGLFLTNTGSSSLALGVHSAGAVEISSDDNANFTATSGRFEGIAFKTSAVERMRITETGNVGVGVDAPTEKLEVAGTIKSTDLAGSGKRNVVADENGKLVIGGAAGGATLESLTGGIRKVDQANPTEWAKPGTFCLIQTTTAGITMPDPSQYSSKVFAVNNQSGTQLNYGGSYQPLGATTLDGGKGHFLMSDGTAWYVIGGSY